MHFNLVDAPCQLLIVPVKQGTALFISSAKNFPFNFVK